MKKFMYLFIIIIIGTGFSGEGFFANYGKKESYNVNTIVEVDHNARKKLGVGLFAISMLLQSGDKIFLLKDALSVQEKRGVDELVSAGYVNKSEIPSRDGVLINLALTVKGSDAVAKLKDV